MLSIKETIPAWCGSFNFETGQIRQWQIGPLSLIIQCLKGEWKIAHERRNEFEEHREVGEVFDSAETPDSLANISRYVFRESDRVLTISPLLADRSVISRPDTALFLTAGEEVTLYVSTPLWVSLKVGKVQPKELGNIPVQRPSDTWFGPSTREGKLCYATTTHCRINLDELIDQKFRAITPIRVLNQADTTLTIERLNLPVPALPIYVSTSGLLWTPRVTLKREEDGDMAELIIEQIPPREALHSRLMTEPREEVKAGALIRAFNAVFS